MIGHDKITKDGCCSSAPVVQMVTSVPCFFEAINPGSNPPFAKLFFLPFQISYHIVKAVIFNKNEGNNKKVVNKVSVRVGVGRALLSQKGGIHLIV